MRLKTIAIALLAAGGLSAGTAGALGLSGLLARDEAAAARPAAVAAPIAPMAAPNYRAIVQREGPAVVGIVVDGKRRVSDEDGDEPTARGLPPGFPFFVPGPRTERPYRGQGSGFIVSADGVVLTNAHVVKDGSDVTVKLQDRREFRAKVLGLDEATDVAVLKIDAKDLPVVSLGDPRELQVGDYVLAIGAPFGLEQTATQGIVSAKGRALPGDGYVPFIQTDAAVNPGNSGGPLFDAGGRVVGINAQIYSRDGGFQGLAFAIPIDVALRVRDQIARHGKVEHARLGVVLQDLNQPLAESFGLARPDGALVADVDPKSAAARAGLAAGDVIVRIDGQPVTQANDVSSRVGLARPGDAVTLQVWRERSSREMAVKLGAPEKPAKQARGDEGEPAPGGKLGLAARPLSPEELEEARVPQGLLVLAAGGPAAKAGIQRGDVVLSLNGLPVTSTEQIRQVLEKSPKHVALLIQREGQRIFVPVELG